MAVNLQQRLSRLAATVLERSKGHARFMVAIAGPPGAGKSTICERLANMLAQSGETAAVVPMDGFHFDNHVLEPRGLLARKGAPETFDAGGLLHCLRRLRDGSDDVTIPLFDRSIEIARAGAAVIDRDVRLILVEGNYLLLDEEPWRQLGALFDFTVLIEVDEDELERRLVRRWLDHGFAPDEALRKALSNDIPNARHVAARSRTPDLRF